MDLKIVCSDKVGVLVKWYSIVCAVMRILMRK